MGLLSLIVPLVLCAAIEVGVAPDQPLPFVYTDEPLILEIRGGGDRPAALVLNVECSSLPAPVEAKAGPVMLRSGSSTLVPIEGLPKALGIYKGKLRIEEEGSVSEAEISFCRVERAKRTGVPPVYAHTATSTESVLAAKNSGASALRIVLGAPEAEDVLLAAGGMRLIFAIDTDIPQPLPDLLDALSEDALARVVRWEIDTHGDPERLRDIAAALRARGSNAPIALVVGDAAGFEQMLVGGAGAAAREAVLVTEAPTGREIKLLNESAERAGIEGFRVHVLAPGAVSDSTRLLQLLITNLAAGATDTGVAASLLFDGQSLRVPFVLLAGPLRKLTNVEPVGNLSIGVPATLFRSGARWTVALWTDGADRDVVVPIGSGMDIALHDAAGNPIEVTPAVDGNLTVRAGAMPIFLSGRGGALLADAARNKANTTVRALLDNTEMGRWLPEETRTALRTVSDRKLDIDRTTLLGLMRQLPELEKLWHEGKVPRTAITPAIAGIARLARALCTIEEERGQPMLEPMHDMLSRGEEFQSLYLTGSVSNEGARERGDWLVAEVRRLIDDAKLLDEQERPSEAASVAALAEWRARALEHAAKAGPASNTTEEMIASAGQVPAPAPVEVAGEVTPSPVPDTTAKTAPASAPAPAPAAAAPMEKRKQLHTVKRGETPASIAKQYGMTEDEFCRMNGIRKGAIIRAGREYSVMASVPAQQQRNAAPAAANPAPAPAKSAEPESGTGRKITHKVAKGDNPSVIAKKYGVKTEDFLKWNGLKPSARFQIGEEYVVYLPTKR